MPLPIIETPIEYIKGVGPQRADVLKKELQIFTIGDLITLFPFRYVDRSKFYKIHEINEDLQYVQIRGKIIEFYITGQKRASRLIATFADDTGTIDLVWFNGIKWVEKSIQVGQEYIVFGKPNLFNRKYNILHPELENPNSGLIVDESFFRPVYPSTEKLKTKGLDSKGISKVVFNALSLLKGQISETIDEKILKKNNLIARETAFYNIHFPKNYDFLNQAQLRLKFEELFFIQIRLLKQQIIRKEKNTGLIFAKVGEIFNTFYAKNLPFELTDAQKRVIKEIRRDLGSGKQMNRLLQGDVGSGKTVVALISMLIGIDNKFQSCLMAPTEILAQQHHTNIMKLVNNLPIKIALLTGSTKKSERKKTLSALLEGEINILIGTHALIEDNVQYKNLGLVIIDEQHRFGVEQRAKLWNKNVVSPHILVMTATPIPRTLAMTVYGDLDVSIIDELPPGRIPIITKHFFDSERLKVFGFIKKQISLGRQIYIVYPLINESEKLDLNYLMEGYEALVREFPLPQYAISILHGQLKASEKDFEMQRFKNKETQIMISTTVIEVGVDVPNATVMIIENAERFGLSQLHQLRGRVGRGSEKSYCILMTSYKLTTEAKSRIETMVRTNNGFEIAEADLKLRGPGDLDGTQQSGLLELKITNITKDEQIIQQARKEATEILNLDPELSNENHVLIAQQLKKILKNVGNWSLIS